MKTKISTFLKERQEWFKLDEKDKLELERRKGLRKEFIGGEKIWKKH